jgi:hypothetical protein
MKNEIEELERSIENYAQARKQEGFWKALAIIGTVILAIAILGKLYQ